MGEAILRLLIEYHPEREKVCTYCVIVIMT